MHGRAPVSAYPAWLVERRFDDAHPVCEIVSRILRAFHMGEHVRRVLDVGSETVGQRALGLGVAQAYRVRDGREGVRAFAYGVAQQDMPRVGLVRVFDDAGADGRMPHVPRREVECRDGCLDCGAERAVEVAECAFDAFGRVGDGSDGRLVCVAASGHACVREQSRLFGGDVEFAGDGACDCQVEGDGLFGGVSVPCDDGFRRLRVAGFWFVRVVCEAVRLFDGVYVPGEAACFGDGDVVGACEAAYRLCEPFLGFGGVLSWRLIPCFFLASLWYR